MGPDLLGKLLAEEQVQALVEILAAKILASTGLTDDDKVIVGPTQDRRVKRAPAQVVDGDVLSGGQRSAA